MNGLWVNIVLNMLNEIHENRFLCHSHADVTQITDKLYLAMIRGVIVVGRYSRELSMNACGGS